MFNTILRRKTRSAVQNALVKTRQVLFILIYMASLVGTVAAPTPVEAANEGNQTTPINHLADICSTVHLVASEDTYLSGASTTNNYGGSTIVKVSTANSNNSRRAGMLKWDLSSSSIPSNATVSAASMTLYVSKAGTQAYNLYNMRRAWVEGTNDGSAGTGASWTYYGAGTGNWGTPGAANTSSDRYNVNLWGATSSTFSTVNTSTTVNLNSDGIAVVKGWIDGSVINYGLTMQNYSTTTSSELNFSSSENGTEANSPTLNITYCVPITVPTIFTMGTLTAFSTPAGVASAAQTYTVSAVNLTSDLSISAPTGFEISSDGTTYSSSLTLPQTGGSVASTTISVRLSAAAGAGGYGGNITHTSGTATADVAVNGSVNTPHTLTVNPGTGGTVALSPAGGIYFEGDVVTLTATAGTGYMFSGWSGDLSGNDNPATVTMDADKTVAASFVAVTCTTSSLTAAEDTYLSSANTGYNYGAVNLVKVSTGTERAGMLKWNVGTIPSIATITDASIKLYVSKAAAETFYLYNMRRGWVEGTLTTGADSTTSANWETYDGTNAWGTVGAANTSTDRYDTNLWDETTSSFGSTGSATVNLNAAGRAVILGWGAGTLTNYGLTMQNYSSSNSLELNFSSSENSTEANRPTLNYTYCVPNTPYIGVTSAMSAFSTPVGTASAEQSYTVSAINLSEALVITAPAGFEISQTSGSGFGPSLSIAPSSGAVNATIYVRLSASAAEGVYNASVIHTSAGAAQKDVAVNGTVYTPVTLTVNAGTHGTVTLNPAGGSYAPGTVVTLTAAGNTGYAFSNWSGDLTGATNPATITMDGNKTVNASFVVSLCSSTSLEAVEDTYMSSYNTNYNYGAVDPIKITNNSSGTNRGTLMKWSLSSIPSNATVSSASVTVNVTTASTLVYNMYNMRRSWVEGTTGGTGGTSTTSATWLTYDGTNAWGTSGAANTTSDRYTDNMWDAGTSSFTPAGSHTISLNTNGITVLNGWIAGTLPNYGVTIQNYSTTSGSDNLQINASENDTAANRPTLNITYCVPGTGPTITTAGTLNAFSSPVNAYSAEQSYTASGVNLTAPLIITSSSANFEISATGGGTGFGSSVTLNPTDGTASGTIYVRFKSSAAGTFNGALMHTSADAAEVDRAVSGTASNSSPNAPTLSAPDNGATGVSTSPTLEVSVNDPNGDPMNVTFYGRKAGGTAPTTAEDFTLVVVPDTQNFTSSAADAAYMNTMMSWISNNVSGSNIKFVTHVGDLVNNGTTTEYGYADAAFDLLDAAGIPNSVGPGNHDTSYGGTNYGAYFGPSRFTGKSWFGGSYDDYNTYSLFSASGMDFILINLTYQPGTGALEWADGLLKTYSNRRAIVESHSILNLDNSWQTQSIFTSLSDNSNLFLLLCGHNHNSSDGYAYRSDTGSAGQTVYTIMQDYQDYAVNTAYLALYRFSPDDDTIYKTTYSATNGNTIDAVNMTYAMPDTYGSGAPYDTIGTVNGVASGNYASIAWNGLDNSTQYEWYAAASDGTASTNSAAWNFTTGTVANQAPVVAEIPNQTIAEGASFATISLDGYVSDPDNTDAEMTWTYSGNTELGVSITNRVATITVPNENWNGTETITFRATDPGGLYDEDTATFTVTGVNDAPVITGQKALTTPEETALTLAVSDLTISDPDSSSFTLSVAGGANYTVSGTTITPALNFNGTLTVPVTVSDGAAPSAVYNLQVTVTAVNDVPAANPQNVAVPVNTLKSITLTGTDVEDTTLTYTIVDQPAHGTLGGTPPNMTYMPDTDYVGLDSFTFTVTDSGPQTSTAATISIDVTTGVPPTPSSFLGEIHIYDNPPLAGDTLSAFVPGRTEAAVTTTITTNDSNLVYTINVPGDVSGTTVKEGGVAGDTVTFKIGDRVVATGTWVGESNTTLNIHPPAALPGSAYYGVEGSAITFSGSANDWGTDAATYQWDWENDGTYDYTGPSTTHTWAADGSYTVGLKVTDAQGGVGTATVAVNVNNAAPVLAAIGTQSVNELANLTFTATATDNDLPLTFSLVGAPSTASITSGGVFSWTPTEADGPNSYPFTVKVCDAAASPLCAEQSVTVTVNEVNAAPVLNAIGNKSVNEGTALAFTATASDVDIPANTLTFSLVNAPSGASITAGGSFSWTPTEAQGPMAPTFDVCVSDSKASTCETITVTVAEVNAAPVLNAIGNKSVNEGTALSFTATASDVDIPANTLTFSLVNAPSGAFITAGGSFSWTPTEAQGPMAPTFDVCVSDSKASTCETIIVTVAEVNAAPVLNAIGNKSVDEKSLLSFTATASDTDIPANTLTFSLANGTGGSVPAGASITAAGAFSWTPDETQGGSNYTFDVCVSDNTASACETITVTVNEVSVTHSISLVPGWNLISLSVHPNNTAIASVLSSISGNYNLVYAWDATGAHASSGNWLKYAPSGAPYQNNLTTLDETMGIWINMTQADTLEVQGEAPTTTPISLSTVAGGWNLVSYPSATSGALPAALSDHGVGTDFSLIYAYHANDTADYWKLYDISTPAWANDLTAMAPGWGYWVKVSADHTWTVGY